MKEIRAFRLNQERVAIIRYIWTCIFISVLVITVVFNGLAGAGKDPFVQSTGDVSDTHDTCITPSGYTFAIWGVIYFFLFVIAIYAVFILFWKVGAKKSWELEGTSVPVSFLAILTINLTFNIGWLFAWDAENIVATYLLNLILVITNIAAIIFAASSFEKGASALYRSSKVDFWMGIVVLNGFIIYVTWTILAHFVNLAILIISESIMSVRPIEDVTNDACVGILSFLFVAFIVYFIVEQRVLSRVANPLILHYLVYLWAMIGIYTNNKDDAEKVVVDLIIVNISTAVVLFVLRIMFLAFRNYKNNLYAPKTTITATTKPKTPASVKEGIAVASEAEKGTKWEPPKLKDGTLKDVIEKGEKIRKTIGVKSVGLGNRKNNNHTTVTAHSPEPSAPTSAHQTPPDIA